jgi:AmmeMemoRadiSam system protein A
MAKQLFIKDEKRILLQIAREAIVSYITTGSVTGREVKSEKLHAQYGCFVTIKSEGKLRGCIGNFISETPLHQLVREMAVAAATKDPRFYPMKKKDLEDFSLEISVLSPLQKITGIDEIKVGTHGVYMERNVHRGVLLPQVAAEYGWDRETFIQQTALKAGMGKDDWKENTDIFIFSAEVFNDAEMALKKK